MENFFHNIPVLIYSPCGDCAMIHYDKVYFMIRKAIIDVVHMLYIYIVSSNSWIEKYAVICDSFHSNSAFNFYLVF